jgi:hypothetical protein
MIVPARWKGQLEHVAQIVKTIRGSVWQDSDGDVMAPTARGFQRCRFFTIF